jgi:hypothetical protein
MRNAIARKRLKKKMLDRWENEGGRIATDTTSADASRATSEHKGHRKTQFSPSNNSPLDTAAPPTKRRKPIRP